jgi:alkylation response protein AidB-like acyl-CoA dehydrogenase
VGTRRTAASVAAQVRVALRGKQLALPDPGSGGTDVRWSALEALGRRDLAVARLAEGHVDAVTILHEAGRGERPGQLYGVWAARSGGTGAVVRDGVLSGTVRFCSGLASLDRALVAALTEDGKSSLVEVDLTDRRVTRDPVAWQAIGMDASDSGDVALHDIPVDDEATVGPPGFYLDRPGFWWGGGGVAAVWWGGCAGVLDRVRAQLLDRAPDDHQLAHLGALHSGLAATEALLADTAGTIDADPTSDHRELVMICRGAVETLARDVLDRVPRLTGPTALSRDRAFAQALADLQVYVRQHHGERDFAALGRLILAGRR